MNLQWLDEGHQKRVWTAEMARYGQFEVMENEDFEKLQDLAKKYPGFLTLTEIYE